MIVALLEVFVFILVIASTSLLCGLLRTAKAASQETEKQQHSGADEQSTTHEQAKAFRTAS
jgi:hypothetical protein